MATPKATFTPVIRAGVNCSSKVSPAVITSDNYWLHRVENSCWQPVIVVNGLPAESRRKLPLQFTLALIADVNIA